MTFPYSFSSGTLSNWESYLVCNGSIAILKKSFKLTSQADIHPAKWSTEARDYQKIKKGQNILCETVIEQNKAKHQLCKTSRDVSQQMFPFYPAFHKSK